MLRKYKSNRLHKTPLIFPANHPPLNLRLCRYFSCLRRVRSQSKFAENALVFDVLRHGSRNRDRRLRSLSSSFGSVELSSLWRANALMRTTEESIAGPAGVGKSGSAPVTRTPDNRAQ